MKTILSGPEFIIIVSSLFLILTALNAVARLQRNMKAGQARRVQPSLGTSSTKQGTTRVRVITVKKQEVEENLIEAS